MTAVSGMDSSLASKCLEISKALIGQGKAFSFNLTIGTTFTFALDSREQEEPPSSRTRKKSTPSTLRRNARRRKEFLERKSEAAPGTSEYAVDKPAVKDSWSSVLVNKGNASKSLTIKLKKNHPNEIPQLDGSEEVTSEAAVQTIETKPETKTKAAQTIKSAPELGFWKMQWSTEPPRQPIPTNLGPYRPPHSREERGGGEREEDRRPWYEHIDEHFDKLEAEKAKRSKS